MVYGSLLVHVTALRSIQLAAGRTMSAMAAICVGKSLRQQKVELHKGVCHHPSVSVGSEHVAAVAVDCLYRVGRPVSIVFQTVWLWADGPIIQASPARSGYRALRPLFVMLL